MFGLSTIWIRLDELIHDSETAKRALGEKDEGILIDGRKKRKSTKKDKDSLIKQKKSTWYVCKYSKMLLGVRYNERENNKIVTLGRWDRLKCP